MVAEPSNFKYDPLMIVPGFAQDGYAFAKEHKLGPHQYLVITRPQSVLGRRGYRYILLPRAYAAEVAETTRGIVALLRHGDHQEITLAQVESGGDA